MSEIFNHLWQSTLFAAAVALACFALRRNSPRLRYWLWLAASLKFLVPFSVIVSMGARIQLPPDTPSFHAGTVQQISTTFAPASVFPATATPPYIFRWPVALTAVWAAGALLLLLRWFRRWRTIHLAARLATRLSLQLSVAAFSTPSMLEPGVFGVFRPVLLLPEGITDNLTPDQFDAVLTHELRHVRFRDNLTAALHMCVETLFWFHPAVWWIGAKLMDERERDCDEAVLRQGSRPGDYARGIVQVCQTYVEAPLACASGIGGSDLKRRIREIMTWRASLPVTLRGKAVLAAGAFAAVSVPFVIGILRAQSGMPESVVPEFEVASIKPWQSHEIGGIHVYPGGRIEFRGCTLHYLIEQAFNLQDFQVSGGAAWSQNDRYDIDAKPPASSKSSQYIPPYQKAPMLEEQRQMLQSLLVERFQFKYRRETREGPVYLLVKGNKPLKMTDPKDKGEFPWAGPVRGGPPFAHGIVGINESMGDLASRLAVPLGRLVLDRTGITGSFDFRAEYTSDDMLPDIVGSILASVQDLGLKLEPSRGPVETIVVDHIEKPSAN